MVKKCAACSIICESSRDIQWKDMVQIRILQEQAPELQKSRVQDSSHQIISIDFYFPSIQLDLISQIGI